MFSHSLPVLPMLFRAFARQTVVCGALIQQRNPCLNQLYLTGANGCLATLVRHKYFYTCSNIFRLDS
jgi:hypothetical protein